MSGLHVLGSEGDGNVEIEIETEDGAGDEDNEDREGCVFIIGDLDFHGAEFDAPACIFVMGWWLEPHMLPVG